MKDKNNNKKDFNILSIFKNIIKIRKQIKKKRKKNKTVRIVTSITLIFIIFFLASKLMLLNFGVVQEFNASIYYLSEEDSFYLIYDIEHLNNVFGNSVGDELCVPTYLTTKDDLISIDDNSNCIKGYVVDLYRNKAELNYSKLDKLISREEFLVLFDDSEEYNVNVKHVKLRYKVWFGMYQLVEIVNFN